MKLNLFASLPAQAGPKLVVEIGCVSSFLLHEVLYFTADSAEVPPYREQEIQSFLC